MNKKKTFWFPLAGSIVLLLLLVLAILSVSSAPSLAADSPQAPADVEGSDSWTWRGPYHDTADLMAPQVNAIVIDSANPSIVYAATNQGVYRSPNTGATWEPRNEGMGGYGGLVVEDLEIDPTNHQRLVIGTWGYGLAESTDAGLHWRRLTDPLAATDLRSSTGLDPAAPQVRAGGTSNTKPVDALDLLKKPLLSVGLLEQRQPTAGEQVESPQGLPVQLPWTPVRDVAINPDNPNQLFACVDLDSGGGLYESNNGGDSWSLVGLGTSNARTYTFAPSNSAIRYASFGTWSTPAGLYRTTTGGSSWTVVGSGQIEGTVVAVAIHPTDPNIVLVATADEDDLPLDGLFRSSDGGDSWTNVSDTSLLPEDDFYSVAFAPGNPDVAYAGGDLWVFRSGDAGATWTNADTSFPALDVKGLAIHPDSYSTVLVGASYYLWGGVYKRTIDGNPFALTVSGMTDTFVLDIEQDPNNANVLYAATWGAGAFRSDTGGLTWDAKLPIPYVTCLEATEGPTGTILYAGTFYGNYGIFKSWNQGETWRELNWESYYSSDESFDIKSLDGEPDNLVAATFYGVERSWDGGETWVNATGLDRGLVLNLAQSPTNPNWLMAATFGGGVWSSTDGGSDWIETSTGLDTPYVYDVAFAPWDSDTAYAASLGIYRTANGGDSWSLSGLSSVFVRSLATRGAPGYDVFAGTVDRGVYVAPQHTNMWLDRNEGLGEDRILTLSALNYDTLFAGTNGLGAWEYTVVNLPQPEQVYLPLVLRNYSPPPTEVVLSETFEGAFPGVWIVGDDNSDDGSYFWGKRNCKSYGGSYSGWAAGAGDTTLTCASEYRDNMSSWMIYGPFSLSGASGAELTFKLWINSETDYDFLCRYASTDGIYFSGSCTHGYSAGWIDRVLDLSEYVGQPNVWIALRFISDDSVTYPEGAHVDNIEVRKWIGSPDMTAVDVPVVVPDTLHEEPATFTRP